MHECEILPDCTYFANHMFNVPATEEMIKNEYCRGNHLHCARYLILKILNNPDIPLRLRPDQIGLAREFIKQHAETLEENLLFRRIEDYRMMYAAKTRKPSILEAADAVLHGEEE